MFEKFLKKLNIKSNPNKVLTYLLYVLTALLILFCTSKMLGFLIGDPRISNNIPPFMYAIWFFVPVLAFSYYVNSGIPKNDLMKVHVYMATFISFTLILGTMIATWINTVIWFGIEKLPNYEMVYSTYPELFSPGLKTISFVIPFITVFKIIDYFLSIVRDDELQKTITGYIGLSAKASSKDSNIFSCSTVICRLKGTTIPVVVPEKKRYEATLVQGATGTGKTATVLLPMSALDLEKKYFFREYSKRLGFSLLKKGIAYMSGPYDNEFINRNFSLKYIKPRRGMEEQFVSHVSSILQYSDNLTGELVYRDVGITVVENDGKYISDFISVAKNFDIDVLSVDPTNIEGTLSINPFAIDDPAKVSSIIADVLKSMYEVDGGSSSSQFFTQVTMDAFQNLAILLKEMYPILNNGKMASLEDMLELLYNFDKVEEMTEEMKKIPQLELKYKLLIAYFEKNFYKPSLNINGFEIPGTRGSGRKETEKFLYGAVTQLSNLLRHPGLKKALCGKTNILQFDKALENGSIITACSRKGDLGIIQSKAFGMFFILQFQDAVLRRKGNEDSRIPHFLYIDEFPEYINKDMEVIFTLFRKYRCGVTIAIQNLSQLEKGGKGSSYYRQTVLANTKTQIIFGDTVPEDSMYWEQAFGKERSVDLRSKFSFNEDGQLAASPTLDIYPINRAHSHKIADQAFGDVYYKTKNAGGKTIYGQGKTSFLDDKYKQKQKTEYYNFEKYMMSKPEGPTVKLSRNSDTDNDDTLFGVNTTTRFMEEIKKAEQNNNNTSNENINARNIEIDTSFSDIEFDDLEPTLENAKRDGGAITETYEGKVINKKK